MSQPKILILNLKCFNCQIFFVAVHTCLMTSCPELSENYARQFLLVTTSPVCALV